MGLSAYGRSHEALLPWFQPIEGEPRVSVSAYDIFLEVAALEKLMTKAMDLHISVRGSLTWLIKSNRN